MRAEEHRLPSFVEIRRPDPARAPVPELAVPTVADAAAIAAAINARSLALHGTTDESADQVATWFALPFLDPGADMRIAVGADGVEGYVDVSGPEDGSPKAWLDLRVAPGRVETLSLLYAWAWQRAEERVGTGGVVQVSVDAEDVLLLELLEREGFGVVRSSFQMQRSLDGTLDRLAWPAGIDVREPRAADLAALHAAHVEAFADHWGYEPESYEAWAAYNLGDDQDLSLWRVAWDGGEVAGVAINRPRRGEDDALGWVGVLAVRRPWRRLGLGTALLRQAFLTFAERGKERVGLGVDAENTTGAVALYERAGMHVVRRSDTWERRA
jgi:mycothiol synthase